MEVINVHFLDTSLVEADWHKNEAKRFGFWKNVDYVI